MNHSTNFLTESTSLGFYDARYGRFLSRQPRFFKSLTLPTPQPSRRNGPQTLFSLVDLGFVGLHETPPSSPETSASTQPPSEQARSATPSTSGSPIMVQDEDDLSYRSSDGSASPATVYTTVSEQTLGPATWPGLSSNDLNAYRTRSLTPAYDEKPWLHYCTPLNLLGKKGVKLFECTLCRHRQSKQAVVRHIATKHLRIRKWPCSFCGKRFPQKSSMQIHTDAVHTHIKRYACKVEACPVRFSDPACRRKHMKRVHPKVPCAPRPAVAYPTD